MNVLANKTDGTIAEQKIGTRWMQAGRTQMGSRIHGRNEVGQNTRRAIIDQCRVVETPGHSAPHRTTRDGTRNRTHIGAFGHQDGIACPIQDIAQIQARVRPKHAIAGNHTLRSNITRSGGGNFLRIIAVSGVATRAVTSAAIHAERSLCVQQWAAVGRAEKDRQWSLEFIGFDRILYRDSDGLASRRDRDSRRLDLFGRLRADGASDGRGDGSENGSRVLC